MSVLRGVCLLLALLVSVASAQNSENENPAAPPTPSALATTATSVTIYCSDPGHIWNRLHRALFIRVAPGGAEYGGDALDPLLWADTNHLLAGDSHREIVELLDEFISQRAATLIADPVKRAVLQRDLWAVFDWLSKRENATAAADSPRKAIRALQTRLATIIRALALTKNEIAALPDNYADAVKSRAFPPEFEAAEPSYLPADLLTPDGPWIGIEKDWSLPALVHTQSFGGRSTFMIFMRLPGGRAATLDYLKRLNDFREPWIFDLTKAQPNVMPHCFDKDRPPWVNPELPQFPAGTQLALLRQMLLIDEQGEIVPTNLTESVQIRVYGEVDNSKAGFAQSPFEFKFRRAKLFAREAGGLQPVKTDEQDFTLFLSTEIDPFEVHELNPNVRGDGRSPAMNCYVCHDGPGIHSVLSHSQLFGQRELRIQFNDSSSPQRIKDMTVRWKKEQASWGLLQGLWLRDESAKSSVPR